MLKFVHWHEVKCGEWQAGTGNPVLGEADRRGQYWAEGSDPHSIWVVPLAPAPWEPKDRPAKPVCLYTHGDGTWSMDWSRAKSARTGREPPREVRRGASVMRGAVRRRPSAKRQEETAARKAEIERGAEAIEDDAPDFMAFLARWGDRYNDNNLRRLWVQAPRATCLHKYGTWQGMGRQVRKGETAILLMQPRTGTDPERITADNPEGKVFYGASWMALFDYAQTDPIGEFTETAGPDADPDRLAEFKRLRMEAASLHPDRGGDPQAFMAAWARYEAARDRLNGNQRQGAR